MTRLTVAVEPERVQIPSGSAQLDPESRAWIEGLRATGAEHARALERLHDLLLRAAYSEAQRRRHLYPEIDGAELDDLCRQAADDAVKESTRMATGVDDPIPDRYQLSGNLPRKFRAALAAPSP